MEFGAGSGVLASQILFELGRLNSLPNKYYIIELSAHLRHKQKQTIGRVLPELIDRIEWLTELPIGFSGVVIANEVLDAMPAKRLTFSKGNFVELGVNVDESGFHWQKFNEPYLNSKVSLPFKPENEYTTEVNLQAMAWVSSLYDAITQGTVLLIDYGMDRTEYFHPQRNEGTLRCFYKHKASDNPFCNIGLQDITTSVNFSDIADSAINKGFKISGYCTQTMFLISLGIESFLTEEKDNEKMVKLAQQVKQLVLPGTMGEVFKVLALSKKQTVKLDGFKEKNLVSRL